MRLLRVAAFVAFFYSTAAYAVIDHPEKIGIGTWEFGGGDFALTQTENLNFKWYYTWRTTELWASTTAKRTVPFVPMMWDETKVNEAAPKASGVLLGFNEPDHREQSNMSVDQAIQLWPKLMGTGLRLGSPAMAGNALSSSSWLGQFMSKANSLNYRVDFIAIHFYSSTGDVNAFKTYLEGIYNTYKKPIWVTEWALVDWSNPTRYSYDQNAAFAKQGLEMLDDLPFVERHAWFSMPSYPHFGGPQTSLFDANVNLTSVGQVFQQVLAGTAPTPEPIPEPTPSPGVDTVAPSVSLSSLVSGSVVYKRTSVKLTSTASDNVGVTQVLFYVNGKKLCSDSSAPYTCTWKTPKQSGSRTIEVKARDAAGNIGSSGVIAVQVN